ncbi:tetratricopeptide repeat-containing diguanylate cyclase [Actinotalea subterranea]|uniref:tetratricopeptide repeat-containing diguanylate cyclase n=1 Tax=Actinotalea subterranea TaxID=2607497 RepID=UPI0011EDC68D|nr:tetratricopeptide repeat-containing diguanylate cyclase [Actinotalea subterranea]
MPAVDAQGVTGTMTPVDRPDHDLTDPLADELEFLLDSDPTAAARLATAEAERAHDLGDEDAEMRFTYYAAYAHHLLGADAAALRAAARAEALADERGELVWQSRAVACRGLVHHELGDVEDAVDLLRRAVDLRREAHDAAGTAEILNSLGTVYTGMVQFAPEAAQVLTDARRLWLSAGDSDRASVALANLAKNYVATSARIAHTNRRGAMAAARQALVVARQAVDEADAAGLARTGVDARLAVAGAHLVEGDLAAAGAVLGATAAMLDRFPSPRQQLVLHLVRTRWLVLSGRHGEAIEDVERGLELCDDLGRPTERLELLRTLVDAHEGAGDVVAALARLHEVDALRIQQSEAVAERRAVLLSSRLDVERAERAAEAERRRAQALEARNARLAHEATHDALTGLANRRALDTALAEWIGQTSRPFAVALVDIDHFKRVNDEHSHQVGDQVLARLGKELRTSLRDDDIAARYGGEEFALVLSHVDTDAAFAVCERARSMVAALTWDGVMPGEQVTVSIGVATCMFDTGAQELLSRADAALYRAKAEGRNQVRLAP